MQISDADNLMQDKGKNVNDDSTILTIITPKHRELAVFGYVRTCVAIDRIPIDILFQILFCFDHTHTQSIMTLTGESTNKLMNKIGAAVFGKIFTVKGYKMRCILTLHPEFEDEFTARIAAEYGHFCNDYCKQFLYCEIKNNNRVVVCSEFYRSFGSEDYVVFCKDITIFDQNHPKNLGNKYQHKMVYSSKKSNNYFAFVDIMQIIDENNEIIYNKAKIELQNKMQYTWNCAKQTIQLECEELGRFSYSPNFNNNCFSIFINKHCEMGIILLGLPTNVQKIKVKFKLKLNCSSYRTVCDKIVDYAELSYHNCEATIKLFRRAIRVCGIKEVRVDIEIINVWNAKGDCVKKSDWCKYHIVSV